MLRIEATLTQVFLHDGAERNYVYYSLDLGTVFHDTYVTELDRIPFRTRLALLPCEMARQNGTVFGAVLQGKNGRLSPNRAYFWHF